MSSSLLSQAIHHALWARISAKIDAATPTTSGVAIIQPERGR